MKNVKTIAEYNFDVVIAGGGTGGVIAAIASARSGASTALVEQKGYVGGMVVEGGTALHSFYNTYKGFPGREKTQIVKGIPSELIDRLIAAGGCSGHMEMDSNFMYDSICTAVDVEVYKLVAFEMLREANVHVFLNSMLTDATVEDSRITAVRINSHMGASLLKANSFVDCTAYGDLCACAGASFIEPNDHHIANSIGVAGVDVEKYYEYFREYDALQDVCYGARDGEENRLIRVAGDMRKLPGDFYERAREIGMASVITTIRDDYFMFLKLNLKISKSPTDIHAATDAEYELRRRQKEAIALLREYVPGCEKAFIARSSPSLCIRRARCIECDYDMSMDDISKGRHFHDDIGVYGFHDESPRYTVNNGGTYGIPYRALLVKGINNLYATGMMITSEFHAHMSTRNTVSCMLHGQGAGTAAALCAANGYTSRELPYEQLRAKLETDGVYLDNGLAGEII